MNLGHLSTLSKLPLSYFEVQLIAYLALPIWHQRHRQVDLLQVSIIHMQEPESERVQHKSKHPWIPFHMHYKKKNMFYIGHTLLLFSLTKHCSKVDWGPLNCLMVEPSFHVPQVSVGLAHSSLLPSPYLGETLPSLLQKYRESKHGEQKPEK